MEEKKFKIKVDGAPSIWYTYFQKGGNNMGKKKRKKIKKISLKDVSSWLELVIKLITIAILLKQLIG